MLKSLRKPLHYPLKGVKILNFFVFYYYLMGSCAFCYVFSVIFLMPHCMFSRSIKLAKKKVHVSFHSEWKFSWNFNGDLNSLVIVSANDIFIRDRRV